ncbi:MAG: hypothetical protein GXO04_05040, partial [Aquificae bacterium]|nr:hypothetical protein [Aquificota bacterium]
MAFESLRELVDCVNALGEPFAIIDLKTGKIVFTNAPFGRVYGKDPKGEDAQEVFGSSFLSLLRKASEESLTLKTVTLKDSKKETLIPYEVEVKKVVLKEGAFALVHFRELTQSVRIHEKLACTKRIYETLGRIN